MEITTGRIQRFAVLQADFPLTSTTPSHVLLCMGFHYGQAVDIQSPLLIRCLRMKNVFTVIDTVYSLVPKVYSLVIVYSLSSVMLNRSCVMTRFFSRCHNTVLRILGSEYVDLIFYDSTALKMTNSNDGFGFGWVWFLFVGRR